MYKIILSPFEGMWDVLLEQSHNLGHANDCSLIKVGTTLDKALEFARLKKAELSKESPELPVIIEIE